MLLPILFYVLRIIELKWTFIVAITHIYLEILLHKATTNFFYQVKYIHVYHLDPIQIKRCIPLRISIVVAILYLTQSRFLST